MFFLSGMGDWCLIFSEPPFGRLSEDPFELLSEPDGASFSKLQFWLGHFISIWDVSPLTSQLFENFLCNGEWWELTVVVLSLGFPYGGGGMGCMPLCTASACMVIA